MPAQHLDHFDCSSACRARSTRSTPAAPGTSRRCSTSWTSTQTARTRWRRSERRRCRCLLLVVRTNTSRCIERVLTPRTCRAPLQFLSLYMESPYRSRECASSPISRRAGVLEGDDGARRARGHAARPGVRRRQRQCTHVWSTAWRTYVLRRVLTGDWTVE